MNELKSIPKFQLALSVLINIKIETNHKLFGTSQTLIDIYCVCFCIYSEKIKNI